MDTQTHMNVVERQPAIISYIDRVIEPEGIATRSVELKAVLVPWRGRIKERGTSFED